MKKEKPYRKTKVVYLTPYDVVIKYANDVQKSKTRLPNTDTNPFHLVVHPSLNYDL